MNIGEWVNYGIDQGYCSAIFCTTHEGPPLDELELRVWEDGGDPCAFAVRVIDVTDHRDKSKINHPANGRRE